MVVCDRPLYVRRVAQALSKSTGMAGCKHYKNGLMRFNPYIYRDKN